jgi:hypothetical protein
VLDGVEGRRTSDIGYRTLTGIRQIAHTTVPNLSSTTLADFNFVPQSENQTWIEEEMKSKYLLLQYSLMKNHHSKFNSSAIRNGRIICVYLHLFSIQVNSSKNLIPDIVKFFTKEFVCHLHS